MNSMYVWLKKPESTPSRAVARDLSSSTSFLLVCRKLPVTNFLSLKQTLFSKTYTHLDARSWFQATRHSDPNQGPYYARRAIRDGTENNGKRGLFPKITRVASFTRQKAAGTAVPSFTSRLISDNLAAGMGPIHDEEDIKGVAGTLYGGTCVDRDDFSLALTLHMF